MTITVDNVSFNDLAIKYLKQILNLRDGSVLNADFLYMRYAAHILNFFVKDGPKDVDAYVVRDRATMKYMRSSTERLQKFKACVEEENISSKKVGSAPGDENWDKVAYFLPFLEIFYEATLSFSGSRHKLRYVEWIVFRSYNPSVSYVLCQWIKDTLTSLFDYYASLHPYSTQMRSCTSGPNSHGRHGGEGEIRKLKRINLRKDYVTEVELNDTSKTTTELDRYFGDKCVRDNDTFDILAWCTRGNVLDSFLGSLTPRKVGA
ncbi:hypothetical protein F3Y22_tig00110890pilonHSYRG00184 [Hibiscus syriacus]|uniref:Uncharacterized protein n=1 Tax=Hibiscus syriacus TaxID=106335 RepID=A0A6A2ZHC3_HIBSY|nr:hypothetical protein F3Y22_tig00110890pilonHSYRG00184 [Hibiscus syriacus]